MHIINDEILKTFFFKQEWEKKMLLTLLFNIVVEVLV